MNLNTLKDFRHQTYHCFQRAADTLFNLVDALLTETEAKSFPELSPFFERKWASLYEALEDGRLDREGLRKIFAEFLAHPEKGKRLWLAIDASGIARPESKTARDRTVIYQPNQPESSRPISYGWQFSTVVVLPDSPSSWVAILDQERIESQQTAIEVAHHQLLRLLPNVGSRPVVVADRWYSAARFLALVASLACDLLVRVKRNQVFYRPAPPKSGKRGAPRKHGARLQCSDVSTHGTADEQWKGMDAHGKLIEVSSWKQLHLRKLPDQTITLFRIIRHGASEQKRDPRESWFLWMGSDDLPLAEVWKGYQRRYSQEHGYRFQKQSLLWSKPRVRSPEQFERWSDVVAIVMNHLVLARELGVAQRRPWETMERQATPGQVRRAMSPIIAKLGTPAQSPKPRGKSAGRQKGATIAAAVRYEVVRKPKKVPKKRHQTA
jgi:DDE superfamily endonuclease